MDANRAFAEKFRFPFPLLSDMDRKVGMSYGACDAPSDECARRVTYVIGPDGKIEQAHGKVEARKHPFTLLSSLGD